MKLVKTSNALHLNLFADAHPELPLAFAYDMRNLLAHGYYKVDVNVVWKTIERDLPYLQKQVIQAVSDL